MAGKHSNIHLHHEEPEVFEATFQEAVAEVEGQEGEQGGRRRQPTTLAQGQVLPIV